MKMIKLTPNSNTDIDEFRKSISFVSSDICSVDFDNGNFFIGISSQGNEEKIKDDLVHMMAKYRTNSDDKECFFELDIQRDKYYDCYKDCGIYSFGNGQVGFDEKGKFLLDYFDNVFYEFAKELGAIEKLYPVMLPIDAYLMTGYIKKSPQYVIFCSSLKDSIDTLEGTYEAVKNKRVNEEIKEPEYALSPSACFHVYLEYQNRELAQDTLITFRQNVFRNEGRLNYSEKGRLCDYYVREIVMIGSYEYCLFIRDKFMKWSANLMERTGLSGDISLASDSFVLPKMQKYRKIQQIDKSKYEMHLSIEKDETLYTASYNIHSKAFTDPFNISVKDVDTVTACIGFGLQRFVLAFFSQYGSDEEKWPEKVKNAYKARMS